MDKFMMKLLSRKLIYVIVNFNAVDRRCKSLNQIIY